MGTVMLHHNDSSDRVYESTHVHPLLKLMIHSEQGIYITIKITVQQ